MLNLVNTTIERLDKIKNTLSTANDYYNFGFITDCISDLELKIDELKVVAGRLEPSKRVPKIFKPEGKTSLNKGTKQPRRKHPIPEIMAQARQLYQSGMIGNQIMRELKLCNNTWKKYYDVLRAERMSQPPEKPREHSKKGESKWSRIGRKKEVEPDQPKNQRIFRYRCEECPAKFDSVLGPDEDPICDSCGSSRVTEI